MKKKYNLALIPTSKGNEVITLAKKFAGIANTYILSEKSLPHVTLYQFQAKEEELSEIWQKICSVWQEKTIDLEFNQFSGITFDNHIFWISLLPNQSEALHKMHLDTADILQLPVKQSFDPHMTLINSRNKEYEKAVALISGSYKPIYDTFILSLGTSDDVGQLTKIIYRYDAKKI